MTNRPDVAIITANYNKGECVKECVASVLGQTHENWEFFFIDDGSDDGSFEMAQNTALGDNRCHFITNTTGTKGANAARNLALGITKSEFIIFLDSDDFMTPECLERRLKDFASNPDSAYHIYPMGIFFDEVGDSEFICNIPTEVDPLYRFLDRDIVWLISGPIWKRESLEKLGGFDLSLESQQDYDLHVRALIQGLKYTYHHKAPDIYYRRNVSSLPRKNSQSVAHFRQRHAMILRHLKMLHEAGKLDDSAKLLMARYLLDIAQMMRWHIATLGKREALKEALEIWGAASSWDLVSPNYSKIGERYIRFKHQMLYNRLPMVQKWNEERLKQKLPGLIFTPSKTYCQVTLRDYESK